ncbi:hypothetical protein [Rhizobium hainanense]|uniref:Uncharacterized protein n=1 Tax=Rhizobium hainanense TaxID=52131 RepID=A0A1C3WK96_9HYPH|nr:hypothetical protein [Rhizobium hainanense]SCB40266.1 hypothetical protein GA0061100_12332 [Rhizobium hainanense]
MLEPNGLIGAGIALVAVGRFVFSTVENGLGKPTDAVGGPNGSAVTKRASAEAIDFRKRESARALMRGANAAVVSILGAALYDPVFTSAIVGRLQFALARTFFVLLMAWKTNPWIVVLVAAEGGLLIGTA